MIINIDIPFDFGDIVYLKHDVDQKPFMVIGVKVCADNGVLVELQSGGITAWSYLIEITTDKNVSLALR